MKDDTQLLIEKVFTSSVGRNVPVGDVMWTIVQYSPLGETFLISRIGDSGFMELEVVDAADFYVRHVCAPPAND